MKKALFEIPTSPGHQSEQHVRECASSFFWLPHHSFLHLRFCCTPKEERIDVPTTTREMRKEASFLSKRQLKFCAKGMKSSSQFRHNDFQQTTQFANHNSEGSCPKVTRCREHSPPAITFSHNKNLID